MVASALLLLNRRHAIRHTIRYEILKDDFEGNSCWIESVEGLAQATNRIEELAASDPFPEYYLHCVRADRLIRRLRRPACFFLGYVTARRVWAW